MIEAFLDRYPVRQVQVGAMEWSYFDSGSPGSEVLLLGGGQGDASVFFRQFEAFGATARLVAPTYPAHGDLDRTLDDLASFLQATGLKAPHVVGSSLGGYLALGLAARGSVQLGKLIIACAFADCAAEKAKYPAPAALLALPADTLKSQTLGKLESPVAPASAAHLAAIAALRTAVQRQPADILKKRTLAILEAPPLDELDLPPSQVALLDCEDDPVISPQTRSDLRRRFPDSVRIILAQGGHCPAILAADQVNALMRSHLGLS